MSRECIVVLRALQEVPKKDSCDYIGVDEGAFYLAQNHILMKLAVGDFDSIHQEDENIIKKYSESIIHLNPIKDDSDSEHTIKELISQGYDKIHVYGGLGNRIDHEVVNLRLAMQYPNQVFFYDSFHKIYALDKGAYKIQEDFKYFSLFAKDKVELSIKGTKYELDHKLMNYDNLFGLSNEIEGIAELTIYQGILLVIHSNDSINKK